MCILSLSLATGVPAQSPTFFPPVINGIVTTENGIPIPNAEVIVFKYGTTDTMQITNADLQGYFYLDSLPLVYEYTLWVNSITNAGIVFPGQFWYLPVNTKYTPQTPIYLNNQSE
jgi:hypothetical protein